MMRRIAVIVFAREPISGRTKTRLIPVLGQRGAATLGDAFNRDAIAKAKRLRPAHLVIAGDAPGGATRSEYFRKLARQFGARVIDQGPGDLGARMARALRPFASAGGAILFGADTPSLPLRLLARNARLVGVNPVVIAPALDGGYYLVGVRGKLPEEIFEPMKWGGSDVLAATVARLREARQPYCLGPWWYDVDRPADLEFLRLHLLGRLRPRAARAMALRRPHPCPATAALLREPDPR